MGRSLERKEFVIETYDSYQELSDSDIAKYVALWNEEYPTIIDRTSEDALLRNRSKKKPKKVLVARCVATGELIGVLVLHPDHSIPEGAWFTMVVDRRYQRKGIGSRLLEEAMQLTSELHGWVIPSNQHKRADGSNYVSPLGFYKKLGFQEEGRRVIEEKSLELVKIIWRSEEREKEQSYFRSGEEQ